MEEKTYEELIREAISLIPVYSNEWTNYNQSDPGITILQNFAAFQYLQQESILEITEEVTRGLLKLAGVEPSSNTGSRLLLAAGQASGEAFVIPGHKRMYAGEICYETLRTEHVPPRRLKRIFLEQNGGRREITDFVTSGAASGVPVFGMPAEAGRSLCLEFSSLPGPNEEFELYVDVADTAGRNSFENGNVPEFAELSWQCLTQSGWEEITAEDETGCFLRSGRIRFRMPAQPASICPDGDCYVIRGCLKASRYDVPPVIRAVCEPVIEAEQRETLAAMFTFDGESAVRAGNRVEVFDSLTDSGCYDVFVKEGQEDEYIRYEKGSGTERSYREAVWEDGRLILEFEDGRKLADGKGKEIVVVCWEETAILKRLIGQVFGYEDQILELEQINSVIADGFCVLAELRCGGQTTYRFVPPESGLEEELCYELLETEGKIRIKNPIFGVECRLFLCSCAVTKGEKGQVRRGSRLKAGKYVMTAVSPSGKGSSRETTERLKERLMERTVQTAVTVPDYERIARETPGLAIEKASAWVDSKHNRIFVAVKPRYGGRYTSLSPLYEEAVLRHLERHRLISVNIRVMGPRFVPVRISGRICVRSQYGEAPDTVRTRITKLFADQADQAGFGGTVELSVIFKAVQEMNCVEEVYELTGHPGPGAVLYGSDIVLENGCLAYPDGVEISFTQNRKTDGREGEVWRFR